MEPKKIRRIVFLSVFIISGLLSFIIGMSAIWTLEQPIQNQLSNTSAVFFCIAIFSGMAALFNEMD